MNFNKLYLFLLFFLIINGCFMPDKTHLPQAYVLEVVPTFVNSTYKKANSKILLINLPKIAPGFDNKHIIYIRDYLKLNYYSDGVWCDTPQRMLLPILVMAFEKAGIFKAVVADSISVPADLRIDLDIIRLQHEYLIHPSKVRLTIRVKLVDIKSEHIITTQVFESLEAAPSEDVYGAVRASNFAVQKIVSDIVLFTIKNIK